MWLTELIPFKKKFAVLLVGGGDTAHGGLPRLVSPPTGKNLKYTHNVADRTHFIQKKSCKHNFNN